MKSCGLFSLFRSYEVVIVLKDAAFITVRFSEVYATGSFVLVDIYKLFSSYNCFGYVNQSFSCNQETEVKFSSPNEASNFSNIVS